MPGRLRDLREPHSLFEKGYPKSALRRVREQWKCRCGSPSDKRWHLTLSDPDGIRTANVPLCAACGSVLFDKLAGEGWLTSPITGETFQKSLVELAQKEIVKKCAHCGEVPTPYIVTLEAICCARCHRPQGDK